MSAEIVAGKERTTVPWHLCCRSAVHLARHSHFKAVVTPPCALSSTSCVSQQWGRAKEPGFNKPLTDSSSLRCRLGLWQWLDADIQSQEMNPAASVSLLCLLFCIFSSLPVYSSILNPSLVLSCSLLFPPTPALHSVVDRRQQNADTIHVKHR